VHAARVIHRDLKPENLFVTQSGAVKILDFGIALIKAEPGEAETPRATGKGLEIFGTPDYMAPEQSSPGRADERSDIYALGSVLYEMLTGRLPFAAKGVALLLEAKAQGNPESVRQAAPERHIRESVDELCIRALARHPS